MRGLTLPGLAALALVACSEESRRCRSEYASAQEIVKGVESNSTESLRHAVTALSSAIEACDKAGLGSEKSQLVGAKNQLGAHLALLERVAAAKKAKLTPEAFARLVKEGDPSCPKSQSYRSAGKEVRCTGPELVDMGLAATKEYFASRKYKLQVSDTPPRLRAEFGAELYVFTFDKPGDTAGARCLELYPVPGVTLPEAVGRATGARLDKLKNGGSVKAARGELAVRFDESANKQIAKIGDCP